MTIYTATPGNPVSGQTLSSGDSILVSSGGVASSNALGTGSSETVFAGGAASVTTVSSGATQTVSGGTAATTTIAGGTLMVSSGGTATGAIVLSGGTVDVFGGTASGTVVSSGGVISSFTLAAGTQVLDGGREDVLLGGLSQGTTLTGTGQQSVEGVATGATVGSGALQDVVGNSTGPTATGTTVLARATLLVENGIAGGSVVGSGGGVIVSSGATLSGASIAAGGVAVILAGGVVTATTGAGSVVSTGVASYRPGAGFDYAATSGGAFAFGSGSTEYVLPGGIATGGTFVSGAIQLVMGGVASGAVLAAGTVLVSAGTAAGTVVSAFGTLQVYSGTTSGAMLLSGGQETVLAGGVASGTTVTDGYFFVSSGGVSVAAVLGASSSNAGGGYLDVTTGGVASNTTVGRYGSLFSSDGRLVGATVLAGGTLITDGTGTVTGVAISSGGLLFASGGTVASAIVGGSITEAGGVVSGSIILSGGSDDVSFGTATSVSVASGALQTIESGRATGTVLAAGATQILRFSRGVAQSTVIGSGAAIIVGSGATLSGAVLNGGGTIVLLPGALASGTVSSGGSVVTTGVVGYQPAAGVTVFGATAGAATFTSGGAEYVLAGGTATGAVVQYGAEQIVYPGGTASGTVALGSQTVQSGGVAVGSVIRNSATIQAGGIGSVYTLLNGFLTVQGTLTGLMVSSGATATVLAGSVSSATVFGTESVYSGTVASTTIGSGGLLNQVNGGASTATIVSNGGQELIGTGTAGGSLVLSGGLETIEGGVASGTVVQSGGTQVVSGAGTATGTVLSAGALQQVGSGGHVSGTTVQSGAVVSVLGGVDVGGTVQAGGTVLIDNGATASGVVLGSGAVMRLGSDGYGSGGSIGTMIGGGAMEIVSAGYVASNTVVGAGGLLLLLGGTAMGTVNTGGQVISSGIIDYTPGGGYVVRGATVSGGVLGSGAIEYVLSGGVATDVTLVSGAVQVIEAQGLATGTIARSGGFLQVSSGGLASGASVGNGGLFGVFNGGIASGSQVSSGGALGAFDATAVLASTVVSSGGVAALFDGVASGTRVLAGGALGVFFGSSVGSIVSSNGVEGVASGGVASGTVLLTGGNLVLLPGGVQGGTVNSGGLIVQTGVYAYSVFSGGAYYPTSATGLVLGGGAQTYVLAGGLLSGGTIGGGFPLVGDAGSTFNLPTGASVVSTGSIVGTTVTSGGQVELFGSASGLMLGSGATELVSSGGSDTGAVLSGGMQMIDSGTAVTGTVILAGGVQSAAFGAMIGGVVVSSGGRQTLDGTTTVSGTRLLPGGSIDLTSIRYDGAQPLVYAAALNTLTVTESQSTRMVSLAGDYTGEYFHAALDGANGTLITVDTTPCYCAGTRIAAEAGDVPVEVLRIGDRVRTASGALRPIRWIGRRSYDGAFAAGNKAILPITFRAGSLGAGVPVRDLSVSPLHALFLDGVLIPAQSLIDDDRIVQAGSVVSVEYIHVELDSHDILLAEGAPAESFIDDSSRRMFHNAAEFGMLYPEVARSPARYCAPRVEEGELLEAIRARLAALPRPTATTLRGFLDTANRDGLTGWARDPAAPSERITLRILVNGIEVGDLRADEMRPDLVRAGEGDGAHAFRFAFPTPLPSERRHVIEAVGPDGSRLSGPPKIIEPAAPMRGTLDRAGRDRIAGWAWAPGSHTPVALVVTDNGVPLIRLVANRHRADLVQAGIGSGRHGFDVAIPGSLSPLARHVIRVRREGDDAELPGSPTVIEAADSFDPALEQALIRAIDALPDAVSQDRVLSFVLAQADRLLQRRAEAESGGSAREAARLFRRRWGPDAGSRADAPPDPAPRALVIDMQVPRPGHDGGSNAVLSHMRALQALGYEVGCAASDGRTRHGPLDGAPGVQLCGPPFYASVEEVLRRQAGCFDLVYLHRADTAERYMALARQHNPQANIVYAVADLHHLRLARQAEVEGRPELAAASRRMRLAECTAAWQADAVITHSTAEADLLRAAVPGARVHVVPWAVPTQPPSSGRDRRDIAFIGHFAHAPNHDAARWLVTDIMPMVWREDPSIGCVLIGSDPPPAIAALAGPRVRVLGNVGDMDAALASVRLTVAPLRFGAGVKAKVLDSLAARRPCVMTPIAAEGIALPSVLRRLVASEAQGLAAQILKLHGDAAARRAAVRAGLALIRAQHSDAAVTETLRGVTGTPDTRLQLPHPRQRGGSVHG